MPVKTLSIHADLCNIGIVEDFIAGIRFLPKQKRNAALIIATEIFENIVEHAVFTGKRHVLLHVSSFWVKKLVFSYCSSNFNALRNAVLITKPHFDAVSNRYRGFGLLMTQNLARKIYYKQVFGWSKIIIFL